MLFGHLSSYVSCHQLVVLLSVVKCYVEIFLPGPVGHRIRANNSNLEEEEFRLYIRHSGGGEAQLAQRIGVSGLWMPHPWR